MIRLQPILVCVLAVGLHWAGAVHAATANQDSGLERATRTFRLQVYETFRTDRAAYDQRIGQAEQVLRDWRARGAPPSEESRLIAWLAEATRASQPDSVHALPEYQRRVAVYRPLLPPAAPSPPQPVVPDNPVSRVPPVRRQMTEPPAAPGVPALPHLARTPSRPDRDPVPVVPAPVAAAPDAPESSTSPVDLAVLASRIRAFNLTLAEIESELSRPGPLRVERLAMLIDQVDRLFRGRRLSQLYYDALTPRQQQRVDPFASAELTLNLLGQRLFEAQVMLMDDHPAPDQQPQQSDIEQLRSLSDRVKSWTYIRHPESVTP